MILENGMKKGRKSSLLLQLSFEGMIPIEKVCIIISSQGCTLSLKRSNLPFLFNLVWNTDRSERSLKAVLIDLMES